ncbi:MAG: ArsR family transcriptional regulator [Methanomicrobiaceae archaeon]|nr:ArsR family transcriptional regulator [Methanomicrobiaceae archaeon]
MLDGEEVSRLLDILGNRNRRRIIQLLRQKPCFVTEISDRLTISPKAVIEHLQLMEREHLLAFHCDERRRKYYYLSRDFDILIQLQDRDEPVPSQITASINGGKFFNSLYMLKRLMIARENLIANLEGLEKDIEQKIDELMKYGKDRVQSEAELNLILALSNFDLRFEELKEVTGISEDELRTMLANLMNQRIIVRTGTYYKVRDLYANESV